jgi:hypothetical protein
MSASRILLAYVEIFLLGAWIGAMLFFSFAVAPSAFSALPSRHLAGLVVTSSMTKLELLGLIIGPLLILLCAAGSRDYARARSVLLLIMTASAALSRFAVTPRMVKVRASMGGMIDNLPPSDPLRIEFNRLHDYSVALMSIAILSGLAALYLAVHSWIKR